MNQISNASFPTERQGEYVENPVITSSAADEISLIDLIQVLWEGKYIILISTVLAIVAGVIYAITAPESFSTSSYFITKTGKSSGMGSLSQLASLAGISMGSSGNVDPSDYLDKVIQDHHFISGLYERRWFYKGDSLPLEEILRIEKDTALPNWRHAYYMSKINTVRDGKLLIISKDLKTGILTLGANMPDPQLAYDINRYTLDFISSYIRNSIQTQAKEKKTFIEERLREVKADLQNAENSLARFKERNLMSNSPHVMLEEGRLIRNVTLNQEIYLQFQKQYELARIEELDDQTLIQVLKNPEVPVQRSKPKRKMIVIFFFILGIVVGICCSLVQRVLPNVRKILAENRER